ncbi:outer membrane protein assembly factor BamD [Candidatus Latescibacterota bacterium]
MLEFSKNKSKYTLVSLLLVSLILGCGGANIKKVVDAQFYFDRGMQYMERKDYIKAQTDFQTVIESYTASVLVDRAQFMLGEANFNNEDYITAAYEYDRVYKDYPSSMHAEEARYKRALCYYNESPKASLDQENTILAMDEFLRFLDNFPRSEFADEAQTRIDELSEKLAFKEYRNAEVYRKMKKYDAAIQYYRFVIRDYPRSVWADESQYGIGIVHLKQKNYEKAKEVFQRLVTTNVSEELKNKASKKLSYIEKKTN